MAGKWKYYEYDGAYFRGWAYSPDDFASVSEVWWPTEKKWVPYKGDGFKRAFYGNPASKDEAETGNTYFELDGTFYRTKNYFIHPMKMRVDDKWQPCPYELAGRVLLEGKQVSRSTATKRR